MCSFKTACVSEIVVFQKNAKSISLHVGSHQRVSGHTMCAAFYPNIVHHVAYRVDQSPGRTSTRADVSTRRRATWRTTCDCWAQPCRHQLKALPSFDETRRTLTRTDLWTETRSAMHIHGCSSSVSRNERLKKSLAVAWMTTDYIQDYDSIATLT